MAGATIQGYVLMMYGPDKKWASPVFCSNLRKHCEARKKELEIVPILEESTFAIEKVPMAVEIK